MLCLWVPVLSANILRNNSPDKYLIRIYNAVLMSRISDILRIGDKYPTPKWWRLIQTALMSRKGEKKEEERLPRWPHQNRVTRVKEEMESNIRLISVCESVKMNKNTSQKRRLHKSENFHFLWWDLGNKIYDNCQISSELIWKNSRQRPGSWNQAFSRAYSSSPWMFHAWEMCILTLKWVQSNNPIINFIHSITLNLLAN